jgi:hypothetical protein
MKAGRIICATVALLILAAMAGCGNGNDAPVKVTFSDYVEQEYRCSIEYPSEWTNMEKSTGDRTSVFFESDADGEYASINFIIIPDTKETMLDYIVTEYIAGLKEDADDFRETDTVIDINECTVKYSITNADMREKEYREGKVLFKKRGSLICVINVYSNNYDRYEGVFDQAMDSLEIPEN